MRSDSESRPRLAILGTRGIPARHGGFETFVEHFAQYLVRRGWHVRVYCQNEGTAKPCMSTWNGVERVSISVTDPGPWGTIIFDWISMRHACREQFPLLTLGYNTALFSILPRWYACRNVMNMDGLEWKRQKWSWPVRGWFFVNEVLGCWLANYLVADHPGIARRLKVWARAEKIVMIPYGAERVLTASCAPLAEFGLEPDGYAVIIARPEPENSTLEMVRAFSGLSSPHKLVVLGCFEPAKNRYHQRVMEVAGEHVIFPGSIYGQEMIQALRVHARLYLHGHQVGGTNPSLVEAMGCGSAILAHDNEFNRWVAGPSTEYFCDEADCARKLSALLEADERIEAMRRGSVARHAEAFTWEHVLPDYERLCRS